MEVRIGDLAIHWIAYFLIFRKYIQIQRMRQQDDIYFLRCIKKHRNNHFYNIDWNFLT